MGGGGAPDDHRLQRQGRKGVIRVSVGERVGSRPRTGRKPPPQAPRHDRCGRGRSAVEAGRPTHVYREHHEVRREDPCGATVRVGVRNAFRVEQRLLTRTKDKKEEARTLNRLALREGKVCTIARERGIHSPAMTHSGPSRSYTLAYRRWRSCAECFLSLGCLPWLTRSNTFLRW